MAPKLEWCSVALIPDGFQFGAELAERLGDLENLIERAIRRRLDRQRSLQWHMNLLRHAAEGQGSSDLHAHVVASAIPLMRRRS